MGTFPNVKLLLKMLAAIVVLFVLIIGLTFFSHNPNATDLAALIPLALFAFLLYKFGKAGLIAILIFIGGAAFLVGIFTTDLIAITVGLVIAIVGYLLKRIWHINRSAYAGSILR